MIRFTCANCHKELTCLKNEVALVHYMNNDKSRGIDVLRFGDLWGCEKCGCRVVLGLGNQIFGIDIEKQGEILKNHEVIEVKI